jgi:hypothetical protein
MAQATTRRRSSGPHGRVCLHGEHLNRGASFSSPRCSQQPWCCRCACRCTARRARTSAGPPQALSPTPIEDADGGVTGVCVFLFLLVTLLALGATCRRQATSLDSLAEAGLSGRRSGTFIAWSLIRGNVSTTYAIIAVPATLDAGSAVGFFAVSNAMVVYRLILGRRTTWRTPVTTGYPTRTSGTKV